MPRVNIFAHGWLELAGEKTRSRRQALKGLGVRKGPRRLDRQEYSRGQHLYDTAYHPVGPL
jgi:hypothetical protein